MNHLSCKQSSDVITVTISSKNGSNYRYSINKWMIPWLVNKPLKRHATSVSVCDEEAIALLSTESNSFVVKDNKIMIINTCFD